MSSKNGLIVLVVLSLFSNHNFSQKFSFGTGFQLNTGIFTTTFQTTLDNYSEFVLAPVPGFLYKASYEIEIKNQTNIAITTYPFIGLGLNNGYNINSFDLELPILAELYFGDIKEPAFYTGAGFSASYLNSEIGAESSGIVLGPQLEFGGQFFGFNGQLISIRLTYTAGISNVFRTNPEPNVVKEKRNMLGVGMLYNF